MKKKAVQLKYSPIKCQFPDNRLSSIVTYTKNALKNIYSNDELNVIVRMLKEEILKCENFFMEDNILLQTSELIKWYKSVERLKNSEPMAYVLGKKWFYKYPFIVNCNVLIPRPETEEMVELILRSYSKENNVRVLDIGTGSGCIAITLKKEWPHAKVSALDISEPALNVAKENATIHNTEINFILADIMQWTTEEKFDIVVSNPPYIPKEEKYLIPENVRNFEPSLALFTNKSPLEFYERIFVLSEKLLTEKGKLFLECHQNYAEKIYNLSLNYPFLWKCKICKDHSGNMRFFMCEKKIQ